jgi:hypothetical protein
MDNQGKVKILSVYNGILNFWNSKLFSLLFESLSTSD